MRVLAYTNKLPFPVRGAAEQEIVSGIKNLKLLGCEVRVLSLLMPWQKKLDLVECEKHLAAKIFTIEVAQNSNPKQTLERIAACIKDPLMLDGAAYLSGCNETIKFVEKHILEFQPTLIWSDMSFSWPIAKLAKKHRIPSVTRSQNFEADHFLEWHGGWSVKNSLKFFVKYLGEWKATGGQLGSQGIFLISSLATDSFVT